MKKIDDYAILYLNTAKDSNLLLITMDSVTFLYVYTIMIATIINNEYPSFRDIIMKYSKTSLIKKMNKNACSEYKRSFR